MGWNVELEDNAWDAVVDNVLATTHDNPLIHRQPRKTGLPQGWRAKSEGHGNKRVKRTFRTPWDVQRDQERAAAMRELRSGKQFVSWDGEGTEHGYSLLGNSTGAIITGKRLSTVECLTFIWEQTREHKDKIHVSFGFNYDVDHILRDLPEDKLRYLKEWGDVTWNGWKLFYISHKMFHVSKGRSRGVTIYDTLTFFQTSLIKAARQYVPNDERIAEVERGKAGRDSFKYSELDYIQRYWQVEGELHVSIMHALRRSMLGAGIHLKKWHGPGAVAEALIEQNKIAAHIKDSRINMPLEVEQATAYAFFGGRFEAKRIGLIEGPVYVYDIRSAYPAALSQCPMLENGTWKQIDPIAQPTSEDIDVWAIYHVNNLGGGGVEDLGPLPCRNEHSLVYFPLSCEGWYYGHEVKAAIICGWDIEILDGWRYDTTEVSAFTFLKEMYMQRADAKREGNPAQLAYKLGMNSIYGKLAQLIGWDQSGTLPPKYEHGLPPKYHHAWYAGHTTSWCRARIMLAVHQADDGFIACETDSITSTVPLNLRLGELLGEWELETYDRVLYVQSGMYYAQKDGVWIKARTRGTPGKNLPVEHALEQLETFAPLQYTTHRYGGLNGYIGHEKHYTWFDQASTITWGGEGKRQHKPELCEVLCRDGHITIMSNPVMGMSEPRMIPWWEENGNMVVDPDLDNELEEWIAE